MEIGEDGATNMGRKKEKKLTIEDYLFFIDNRDHQLTSVELAQIIGMHGYKRKGIQKGILMDALKSMDLMDLCRSTLQDRGVSGDACLSLKEVIDDLKFIQWHECHVTSLITHGAAASATTDRTVSVKLKKSKGLGNKAVEVAAAGTTLAAKASMKRKKSKGLGKKAIEVAAADHSVISTSGTPVAAKGTTTKRKKAKKPVEVAVDQSVNSTTGTTVAVSVKRRRAKGLGKMKKQVDVDDDPTKGTTVAAGSTTVSVKREEPQGQGLGMELTCGCCSCH